MNILFISLCSYHSIKDRDIYTDVLRSLIGKGHKVCIVSPAERRQWEQAGMVREHGCRILRVKTGNIQKTNMIEKGIATILLEKQFVRAIKKNFSRIKFDLVLYATPPVTLVKAVAYIKKRDGASAYLMLKDIFPQNAVDIGIMDKRGVKGCLYRYFRRKEKKLYQLSDRIGCMSQANVDYILKHNPQIPAEKAEICPNSIEVSDLSVTLEEKKKIRKKYGIPDEKTIFLYGGNLGKPQGIDFLMQCLASQRENERAYFLIAGDGTEFGRLCHFVKTERQKNVKLMRRLSKEDYACLAAGCDIGMLFLDHRFTIPNFPSRLLDYMQVKIPVLAVTDPNTDIGAVVVKEGFGWWCESNCVQEFQKAVHTICGMQSDERSLMGERAWNLLNTQYNADIVAEQLQTWMRDV